MALSLNNAIALVGIVFALCALLLHVCDRNAGVQSWGRWLALACFVALWWPVGAAQMPVAAYVRGFSSDLSVTLVVMSVLRLLQELPGVPNINRREKRAVFAVVAVSALFLYPLALGLGNWDPYRLGWGSPGMVLGLLVIAVAGWVARLRLLPISIAFALLAWTAGLLESTNLWDYLIDPWLAAIASAAGLRALAATTAGWWRGGRRETCAPPSP